MKAAGKRPPQPQILGNFESALEDARMSACQVRKACALVVYFFVCECYEKIFTTEVFPVINSVSPAAPPTVLGGHCYH